MATGDWAGAEALSGTDVSGIQIRERLGGHAVGDELLEEAGERGRQVVITHGSGSPHLPVRLAAQVAGVELKAVVREVRLVPRGLHGVQALREDVETEHLVHEQVVRL